MASAVWHKGRGVWLARWKNPLSGHRVERVIDGVKAGDNQRNRTAAVKRANELQESVTDETGADGSANRMTWLAFQRRVDAELLSELAPATGTLTRSAFAKFDSVVHVIQLRHVDAAKLSYVVGQWRVNGDIAATTIKAYLKHIRAAFAWAKRMGFIAAIPEFPRVRDEAKKKMRGRPITGEEFTRIMHAADEHCTFAADWRFLLTGLWAGGMRIGEAMKLSWDRHSGIWIDQGPDGWLIHFPADEHKAGRYDVVPIAPEFLGLLQSVPVRERRGLVFNPRGNDGQRNMITTHVSKVIRTIGKRSLVVVHKYETGKYKGHSKFASAHDYRRTFGLRWAGRLLPQDLKEVMRHAEIETTLKYYVGQRAKEVGKVMAGFTAELAILEGIAK